MRLIAVFVLISLAAFGTSSANEAREDSSQLSEIVVTSKRSGELLQQHSGNMARLGNETLRRLAAQHASDIFRNVPGGWVVRGSGQEHQTAIRSPVLTGGGACAVFLVLENGIPIRPPGFCNVNLLSELSFELANSIEVIRGPGNAVYGSNAVHGTINVLMPTPGSAAFAGLEIGPNDFRRIRGGTSFGESESWFASAVLAHDYGFRARSDYDQAKLYVTHKTDWQGGDLSLSLSATDLSQESAGFIYGQDAYKDDSLRESNASTDAHRAMESQRLSAAWLKTGERFDLDIRAYLRNSSMGFVHHETPGTPEETNGHRGAGLLIAMRRDTGRLVSTVGLDIDVAAVELLQYQAGSASGPPRVVETRPAGRHYDFEVSTLTLAPYIQASLKLADRWWLDAGLRLEYSGYDYENNMLAGNTRDDGTACGFGGCLYSRPADRSDHFRNVAPKLSISYRWTNSVTMFLTGARGFRSPQTIELYRLQNGQAISDLKTERIDSIELGLRSIFSEGSVELAAYGMRKRDSVFRDSQGFTASGGRSRHSGAEVSFNYSLADAWYVAGNLAYGRHKYDSDLTAQRGESYVAGLDIDSAPRWLGNGEIAFRPPQGGYEFVVQLVTVDSYYLDSLNQFEYGGHTLANLRTGFNIGSGWRLTARINNLADRYVADRADFGGGDYRYLPGRGREAFVELSWRAGPR